MVTIACVKWGDKYSIDYVNRLYNAVKRNLTIPFKFVCFTEDAKGLDPAIVIQALSNSLPITTPRFQGWWYKLELFRKNNGLEGRVFYIDLDTVIVGNIDKIANTPDSDGFIVLRDFYRGYRPNQAITSEMGSGLMAWTANKHTHLWDEFIKNAAQIMTTTGGGDQIWIQKKQPTRKYWQDLFPNQVISYKVHCCPGNSRNNWFTPQPLSKNSRVVCFHGPPRPHEVFNKQEWMQKHWSDK